VRRPEAPVPLFCLPYAGGTAAMYYRWAEAMPPGVAIHPVELPGHGARRQEAPIGELRALVRWLARELAPAINGPYALFGHSLGALLAFEVARALRGHVGEPSLLFVSAHNAPSRPTRRGLSRLADRELLAATEIWGGVPPELDDYPALRRRVLRVLRTDLRIAESYRRLPGAPLDCRVTVFASRSDALVDESGLAAWRHETSGPTRTVVVPGGHLFIHDDSFPAVLRTQLGVLA
jgi:medium-chain acyl-[acyl-carrier-protein] hydrolase